MSNLNETLQSHAVGSKDRLAMWADLINQRQARTVVEVGVWKGDFTAAILAACPSIETYYLIDPWANLPDWNKPFNVSTEQFDDIYAEAMEKTAFAGDKRHVLRGRTKEVVDQIPDGSIDFAYVDGDHTLRGITIDLMRILPKIASGGLLGGDDFDETPWRHGSEYEPTLVCPFAIYFAEASDLPIWSLPHKQFVIENDAQKGFSFVDTVGQYQDLALRPSTTPLTTKLKSTARRLLGSKSRS